jgi:hypothetical protein
MRNELIVTVKGRFLIFIHNDFDREVYRIQTSVELWR